MRWQRGGRRLVILENNWRSELLCISLVSSGICDLNGMTMCVFELGETLSRSPIVSAAVILML